MVRIGHRSQIRHQRVSPLLSPRISVVPSVTQPLLSIIQSFEQTLLFVRSQKANGGAVIDPRVAHLCDWMGVNVPPFLRPVERGFQVVEITIYCGWLGSGFQPLAAPFFD